MAMKLGLVGIILCCCIVHKDALQVIIKQDTNDRIINLSEIELHQNKRKLPHFLMNFSLSSAYFPASSCNDGDLTTFCHSGLYFDVETDRYEGLTSELRIATKYAYFNKIIIHNRVGYENRIIGATISILDEDGIKLWDAVFSSPSIYYDFDVSLRHFQHDKIVPVVDIFPYNGEIVAPFHIKYLFDTVDEFLIIESRYTLSGKLKPFLYFQHPDFHKDFIPYLRKIKYVVIEEFPDPSSSWINNLPSFIHTVSIDSFWKENYQREFSKYFLPSFGEDVFKLVWMGDVDEIPHKDVIQSFKLIAHDIRHVFNQPLNFELQFFYYNFMWGGSKWYQAYLISNIGMMQLPDMIKPRSQVQVNEEYPPYGYVKQAGWHLSFFMSTRDIIRKIESFAHREIDLPQHKIPHHVLDCIQNGKDVFQRTNVPWLKYDFNASADLLPEGWEALQSLLATIQQSDNEMIAK